MSISGSAGALSGLCIGISGAVPTPEERQEQRCSELDILMTVRRLVERIFALDGRIVYGSHPTFTPIIESVALGMFGPGQHDRVTMLVAPRFFFIPEALHTWDEFADRHRHYAVVEPIGTPHMDRQPALDLLREALAAQADALVCIGGKSYRDIIPGVEQEATLARKAGKPLYLLGWAGGHTRTLFERDYALNLQALGNNQLSNSENEKLCRECSISESVNLVIKGLSKIQANRRPVP
jgi:hypothetical protein